MTDFLQRHIGEHIDLNDEEFHTVSKFFNSVKIRKRQFLIQENQSVDTMYLVKTGLLKSSLIDEIGKEHILQFANENWWISDFASFFKGEKSTVAVEVIEDAELFSITINDLEQLCKVMPKMEHFFRVKSNFGYVALQKRILSLMSHTAKERYDEFCLMYPNIFSRVPKRLIANYLGVTRETLSRLQM
ncbi:Crp/Fnr family transcriptional regulator [Sinomicrobium weinanense]|uniref:Crp/Fnr family transcriptional regulator n=1 Tax=Sinomicrobium weinanense TaxID=2842200 RepID=A0A926JVM1_9FLAO|nr:Crp/Fnr family transcriptional regulator [Sinomicrobium weinanense]MBC9798018.1 Crp/Fnr family transcriptional regulator [Sinomicrobium weinanense]MBU3125871.1 Crp/Fnr family transcriptional regulator [Sinomicrobium weinanense]